MKTLTKELTRRFEALPKPQRILLASMLAVFALYNAMEFGHALGRALYYVTH